MAEDISVIGMVSDLMAEIGTPPLTTVGFPAEEMGAAAAQILIPRVDGGPTPPTQLFIEPELTVRGTTGRPRPIAEHRCSSVASR